MIRVIAVTPAMNFLQRKRAVLPAQVPRDDAVQNLQRSVFSLPHRNSPLRPDLGCDADRLHQHYRGKLILD